MSQRGIFASTFPATFLCSPLVTHILTERWESLQSASTGYPPAYNAMGVMFYHGQTLPQDNAAALRWFEAGVRAGDIDSHYNLASMLLTGEGEGVEKDLEKGLKLMKEANRAGHWQAPLQVSIPPPPSPTHTPSHSPPLFSR